MAGATEFIDGSDPEQIESELLRSPAKIAKDQEERGIGPTPNEVAAGHADPTLDADEERKRQHAAQRASETREAAEAV